jgi:cell division protein FtsB
MKRGKKKSLLEPIRLNLVEKLSNTDARLRRKVLRGLIIFVGLFLIYSFFSGTFGFIRIAKLHIEKNHLQQENKQLLVKLVTAEMIRKRLQDDMNYIEYIARTRHHLSRKGEVIYRLKY